MQARPFFRSVFLKTRLRAEFCVFLHAARHRRAVRWAERPSRAAPCDGGLVGDNQVTNGVVRPPLPPVALVSTWRQTAPQRHLREIEPNHQAAQRQIQRGRRRTLAAACTSELLLELVLLLELLLLELLLLELLLLGLLLLETDHVRRTGAPTPKCASGSSYRTAIKSRGVFSSVFGRIFKKVTRDRILRILEFL